MSTITYDVTIQLQRGGCVQVEYEIDQFAYTSEEQIRRAVIQRVREDLAVSSRADMQCEINNWAELGRG